VASVVSWDRFRSSDHLTGQNLVSLSPLLIIYGTANVHSSTPFFRKKVFWLKYVMMTPHKIFGGVSKFGMVPVSM
jgi:hypothetical protein